MRKVSKIKKTKFNGFISDDEAESIYTEAFEHTPQMGIMVGFALTRGMRIEEIRNIRIQDFTNAEFTAVDTILCKSNIKANLPIVADFAEKLQNFIRSNVFMMWDGYLFPGKNGGCMSKAAANWKFYKFRIKMQKKYAWAAEYTDYGHTIRHRVAWHSCRRWFETRLLELGYTVFQVADLLRYEDPDTVRTYWNCYKTWQNERKIIESAFGDFFGQANLRIEKQRTLAEFGV